MAYETIQLPDGRVQVRCTSGRIAHLRERPDGTWIVEEDEQKKVFYNRGAALDCAREIAGDPDLPPLTQV